MSTPSSVSLIQDLYACFLRGQLDAILAKVADNVIWIQPKNSGIPYCGNRTGRSGVTAFFTALQAVEIETFEPQEYFASGDRVFAIGGWSGRARTTGKRFTSEWVMVWTVSNGLVTHFHAYEDTAAVAAAFAH